MMTRFVAFLRGINVGGRYVKNETLKKALASLSFQNVFTYKQSGNIIFETDFKNTEELEKKIETNLKEKLGFDVTVFVRGIAQLKEIIESEFFKGRHNKENTSFLVTFLKSCLARFPIPLPTTIPKSTAQLISISGTEILSETHGGGEGALPNPFIESKLKMKATTRNINIIREIVEKYCF